MLLWVSWKLAAASEVGSDLSMMPSRCLGNELMVPRPGASQKRRGGNVGQVGDRTTVAVAPLSVSAPAGQHKPVCIFPQNDDVRNSLGWGA